MHSKTIVLIHGIHGERSDLSLLNEKLQQKGFKTYNFHYPSTKYPIEKLSSNYLKPFLAKLNSQNQSISFLTHSMGGILLRHYLYKNKDIDIEKIIMLAPPNKGSDLVDIFGNNFIFKKRYGPAGQQIGTDLEQNLHLSNLEEYKVGIIAGDKTDHPYFSIFIPGKDDGKVALTNTFIDSDFDFLIVPCGHETILKSKIVLRAVDNYLKKGEFSH